MYELVSHNDVGCIVRDSLLDLLRIEFPVYSPSMSDTERVFFKSRVSRMDVIREQ